MTEPVLDTARRVTHKQVRREMKRSLEARGRRHFRRALWVIVLLSLALGAAAASLQFSLAALEGDGMAETIVGGDVALVEKASALWRYDEPVTRGNLLLLRHADGGTTHTLIRRLIATAGDEVSVTMKGQVTVNGEALEEPYATLRDVDPADDPGSGLLPNPFHPEASRAEMGEGDTVFPITVPAGKLFVLADDRNASADSRSQSFYLVDESEVQGVIRAVLWPLPHARLFLKEASHA